MINQRAMKHELWAGVVTDVANVPIEEAPDLLQGFRSSLAAAAAEPQTPAQQSGVLVRSPRFTAGPAPGGESRARIYTSTEVA